MTNKSYVLRNTNKVVENIKIILGFVLFLGGTAFLAYYETNSDNFWSPFISIGAFIVLIYIVKYLIWDNKID